MSAAEKKPTPNANQSTEKAMALLELLAQARTPMRLRDISDALGLNPSTALRFLTALQRCGYVSQEESSQRYQLTYKLCTLANQLTSRIELPTVTHPYLVSLAEQLHEVVCVSVEREMTMVYIDVATGPDQTLMSLQRIGNVSPMHCTGNCTPRRSVRTGMRPVFLQRRQPFGPFAAGHARVSISGSRP